MSFFGKSGFIRQQEKAFAKKLLVWKYEKAGASLPAAGDLDLQAGRIVEEAHRIAKQSGGNLLEILKDLAADIRKG